MMVHNCRICSAELGIRSRVNGDEVRLSLECAEDSKYNAILRSLLAYWRWCSEDKPRHGVQYINGSYAVDKTVPFQYYYDSYHNGVRYDGDDVYSADIQMSDSDTGDDWMYVRFKVSGLACIEILEEKWTRN